MLLRDARMLVDARDNSRRAYFTIGSRNNIDMARNGIKALKIPTAADWDGYQDDLDARYLHKLVFGKSIAEVQQYFQQAPGERACELEYVPRRAFQYYAIAFAEHAVSPSAREDADAASALLHLLLWREQHEPGSVAQIWHRLAKAVDFIAVNQDWYDAPVDIYGSFADLAAEIRALCEAY